MAEIEPAAANLTEVARAMVRIVDAYPVFAVRADAGNERRGPREFS
jgi:hypothetical protein